MLNSITKISLFGVIVIIILAFLAGCGVRVPGGVTGSGKEETRDFNLSGFNGIQASNAFNIQVNNSNSFKVQVTADDNVWNYLDISSSGNTLHLRVKPGTVIINSSLKATITMPAITVMDLSGASACSLVGFNSNDNLNVTLSGASTVNINNLKSGPATFDLSGASNTTGGLNATSLKFVATGGSKVTLGGSGTDLNIDASGGSRVTLDELKVQNASVMLSGGSEARLNAQNIGSANLSGGSNLYYTGNPTIGNLQTSGGSNIHKE
jgi:hypothetical protein